MSSNATIKRITTSCTAVILASGCGAAPSSSGDQQEPLPETATTSGSSASGASATTGIHGTLLYSKQLGPAHAVEFYEFGEGATAVHESSSIDNTEGPFLDKKMTFSSLAEAYAKLSAEEVPVAILQADARAARLRFTAAPRATTSEALGGSNLTVDALGAATTCSPDDLGDNWGSSWFLNKFCITGNFRWCPTNYGWADSGQYQSSWSRWTQFEGDFNLPGHIHGTHISCNWFWGCDFRTTIFDYDILPRRYETWTFTDGRDYYEVKGSSQCGHLDAAFLHN